MSAALAPWKGCEAVPSFSTGFEFGFGGGSDWARRGPAAKNMNRKATIGSVRRISITSGLREDAKSLHDTGGLRQSVCARNGPKLKVAAALAMSGCRGKAVLRSWWPLPCGQSRSNRGHSPATGAAKRLCPSGDDRCHKTAAANLLLLPGPRFCPESALLGRSMMGFGELGRPSLQRVLATAPQGS
jgi:hypothetical protein